MEWELGRGMAVLMLLALVGIWTVVAFAVHALPAPLKSRQGSPERDPLEEVERRYVDGEIDRDELLRRRRELRGDRA